MRESTTAMSRTPPPEAQLIRRHREALGISPEVAAGKLKIKLSGRRWRQIEAGEETQGGKPVEATAGTLAHMASVVGVQPDQLVELGQDEAAEILRVINREADREEAVADRGPLAGLPVDPDARLAELTRRLQENARSQQALLEEMERLAVRRPDPPVKAVDQRKGRKVTS